MMDRLRQPVHILIPLAGAVRRAVVRPGQAEVLRPLPIMMQITSTMIAPMMEPMMPAGCRNFSESA